MSAMVQAIQLAYTTGQWWVTMTTALVVGVFFAGKFIPRWLFVLVLILYALTVYSIIVESAAYDELASDYGASLAALRAARHAPAFGTLDPVTGFINEIANYLVYVCGSLGAVAYCITIWRRERGATSARG
jgi:hypothetical protein